MSAHISTVRTMHQSKAYGPLAVLTVLTALFYGILILNPWALKLLIGPYALGIPFLDAHALLSAAEAYRHGYEVMLHNPYDMLNRPHAYHPWWLAMAYLGLSREHEILFGVALGFVFLVCSLLVLRPDSYRQAIARFSLLASPVCVLGLERANNDLIIFIMLVPLAWILLRFTPTRLALAWALLYLTTILKFYPALLFGMFVKYIGSSRAFYGVATGTLVIGLASFYFYREEFAILGGTLPRPSSLMTFGGPIFLQALGVPHSAADLWAPIAFSVFSLAGVLAVCRLPALLPEHASTRETWWFLTGALALIFCYAASNNYLYRCVFIILLVPQLSLWMHGAQNSLLLRRLARVALIFFLLFPWLDVIHWNYFNLRVFLEISPETVRYRRLAWIVHGLSLASMLILLTLTLSLFRDGLRRHLPFLTRG